jgi:hypothetical protein
MANILICDPSDELLMDKQLRALEEAFLKEGAEANDNRADGGASEESLTFWKFFAYVDG